MLNLLGSINDNNVTFDLVKVLIICAIIALFIFIYRNIRR